MEFPQELMIGVFNEDDGMFAVEQHALQVGYIGDAMNPIEYYSDEEFKKRFRFTKKAIAEYILPRVSAHLTKDTARGYGFTA